MRHLRLSDEELAALVHSVQAREAGADERLYDLMQKAFRYYLLVELGPDHWEDRLNNAYVAVLQAIRGGRIAHPPGILGYAHTIISRQVADEIGCRMEQRASAMTEEPAHDGFSINHLIDRDRRVAVMLAALDKLDQRDQQLLRRFYLLEQKRTQIMREMNLTDTQFRLLKSRAKKRLGIHGRAIQQPTIRKQSDKVRSHSA